ncbi:DUF3566 domain-containing protein [Isoptericola sp. 4D.3]|jgi:hypothetical protein|uniref:DUF3566 domain-containing protein n=1 Tax=Isoptericola peretonis TaxID=2918523 RepID=A0ABT0J3X0_9MICO|nr:DUF3566 domain-containing protein [Isoptericola sp. 4D.3]
MTENTASTRASSAPPAREHEIDEATHRRHPAAPQGSPNGAVRVGEVPAPPQPPTTAAASAGATAPGTSTASQGASPVKEGAVKAAAAALAAARSAAKKVQSAMPDGSAKGQETGAAPAGRAPSAAKASAHAEPRPEMHYSAGGVHGTAAPAAAAAGSPMVGTAQPGIGPRRVRLSVSRVDPWSIMKLAFLLSVAIGFITVVATMVVWYVLNDMGTFAKIQGFMSETIGPQAVNLMQFVQFDRVVSLSVLIAIVNVVLLTALATIMAILYNITAALVGGVHLTLTDE